MQDIYDAHISCKHVKMIQVIKVYNYTFDCCRKIYMPIVDILLKHTTDWNVFCSHYTCTFQQTYWYLYLNSCKLCNKNKFVLIKKMPKWWSWWIIYDVREWKNACLVWRIKTYINLGSWKWKSDNKKILILYIQNFLLIWLKSFHTTSLS